MDPSALTPVLRVLRGCLHLLVVALLVIAGWRALTGESQEGWGVVVAAVVLLAVYSAGAALPAVRNSRRAAGGWLLLVGLGWLVLLVLTPDAIWLAFPLFFLQMHLLPVVRGLIAVVLTTVAAIAGFGWHQHELTIGMVTGPVLGAAVAVTVVLGFDALHRESEARRQLIEELTSTRTELAEAERSAGVLAERERLAREVHDTLAQGFSSIQLLLRAAERVLPERPGAAREHVELARESAVHNLEEARRFVRDQAPPDLEAGSLASALQRVCATGDAALPDTEVNLQVHGEQVELPRGHELALLRIAQSALANVERHARAERVEVTLNYMPDEVALDVVDDGVGFDPEARALSAPDHAPAGGFGLTMMRDRARELRGGLAVESSPGAGTAVSVTLPLPAADDDARGEGNR